MFIQSAADVTSQMLTAARSNNPDELGSLAHTMRATSGNLGAVAFSQTCEEIEQICMYEKKRVTDGGVKLCRQLMELLDPTIEVLQKQKS